MQNGPISTTREVIQPSRLSTGVPVIETPWWQASWVIPSGAGASVVVIAALVMLVRAARRRRLSACERGYRSIAKRLKLSSREQCVLREIATRATSRKMDDESGDGREARGPLGGSLSSPSTATVRAPRRGVAIEDVVEFSANARPGRPGPSALMTRDSTRQSPSAAPRDANAPETRTSSPTTGVATREVKPVALLLSERAFLSGAANWLREPGRRPADRERVLTMQRKIFAARK